MKVSPKWAELTFGHLSNFEFSIAEKDEIGAYFHNPEPHLHLPPKLDILVISISYSPSAELVAAACRACTTATSAATPTLLASRLLSLFPASMRTGLSVFATASPFPILIAVVGAHSRYVRILASIQIMICCCLAPSPAPAGAATAAEEEHFVLF